MLIEIRAEREQLNSGDRIVVTSSETGSIIATGLVKEIHNISDSETLATAAILAHSNSPVVLLSDGVKKSA